MSLSILNADALRRALSVRDLTNPAAGAHALQLLIDAITSALAEAWSCELRLHRGSPIVSVADNYDRLHYPAGGAAREVRYTRYVCETAVLRTQTSAMIPGALRALAQADPGEVLLACPGLAYRRDCIDRLHTGEPHQMDLWRLSPSRRLGRDELLVMVERVLAAALPGREWRTLPTSHPYTVDGLQLEVRERDEWVEVGECGVALPALLAENGLPAPPWSGLAMGLGLDRLLMLRKGIPDIRLLRADDPRVGAQMLDLDPYRPVSAMPAVTRDLSLAVDADTDAEGLGDAARSVLGERAALVESIATLSETPYEGLPEAARARIGIHPGQKNVLVRLVLSALDRTLTTAECNRLRDEVYAALHRGSTWQRVAR